jgi:hypothetical protein
MAQIKIDKTGNTQPVTSDRKLVRALAQQLARSACSGIGATTDNSTGVAGVVILPDSFVEIAASGSNLADKTTVEAALATVRNGIAVAAQRGNAISTILGTLVLTDSSGGTVATPGTVPATTKSVTGAATGVQDTEMNAALTAINGAIYSLVRQANQIAKAIGAAPVKIAKAGAIAGTISAIPVAGGTAAAPGVSKSSVDAALTSWANALASLAVVYNTARTQSVKVRAI